jgi:serine/threonine protein kinase HipA of HipAB toxin-antitoxin module
MPKPHVAVLVFAIAFSGAASAQTAQPDPRGACNADYNKFCAGTMPGGGRVVACLNKQHDRLTATCRKVLDAKKKQ